MRIALLTDGIWPYVMGGMQRHSTNIVRYLARRQVHVHLFHFNQSNFDISKLEFFTPEERAYIHPVVLEFPKVPKFPGHYLVASYRYSRLVYQKLEPLLPQLDFIYTKGFTGWELLEKKRSGKIAVPPVGVKFHGYEMFQRAAGFRSKMEQIILRPTVRSITRGADVVFSYGGKITGIIRNLGVPPDRIAEIPAGVESAAVAASAQKAGTPLKFVFLGRFERRKGIPELYGAIRNIPATDVQKCEFHFIGPIPPENRINHDRVIYHGEIRDANKIASLLQACDVIMSPSFSEGMPNAILEGMSNGLAVICTRVGANETLVDNTTGWLLDDSRPETIRNTITHILNHSADEVSVRKANALERIRNHFTWEKLIDRLYDHISKVVSAAK